MSKEKQILHLKKQGYSQRKIAETLSISRNTVSKVFNAECEHPISDSILDSIDEVEHHKRLLNMYEYFIGSTRILAPYNL